MSRVLDLETFLILDFISWGETHAFLVGYYTDNGIDYFKFTLPYIL